jgi:hypothetical protein
MPGAENSSIEILKKKDLPWTKMENIDLKDQL